MNINFYTNEKLADIQFIYGLTNGNGCAAVQLCGERYLKRRQSNHKMFAWVHQNMAEHESFKALTEGSGWL